MTLLFMDGFDARDVQRKWQNAFTPTPPNLTEPGRYGWGSTVQAAGVNSGTASRAFTPSAQIVVGCALKWASGAKTAWTIWADGGVVRHIWLNITSSGAIQAVRASVTLATSAAGVIVGGAWMYVEMKATLHDTTGLFEVRVNGVQVLTFTGDTRNSGTSMNMDYISLGGTNDHMDQGLVYDDFYILNALGTVNNNYLGETVVRTVMPTGAGATTGLTPTGTANNWENVDEIGLSTTDYNAGSVAGARDTYALANIPVVPTAIYGVQTVVSAAKTDPIATGLKPVVRSGGTNYYDATLPLSLSVLTSSVVRENDPATSAAWTYAGVNAVEVGAEVA